MNTDIPFRLLGLADPELELYQKVLSGSIFIACWVVGLFFLRFWKKTGDRFFAIFTAAFWILGFERIVLILTPDNIEWQWKVFLFRLLAFLLILFAVIDKNMKGNR